MYESNKYARSLDVSDKPFLANDLRKMFSRNLKSIAFENFQVLTFHGKNKQYLKREIDCELAAL